MFSVRALFGHVKNSDEIVNELANKIADAKNYDILMDKFSKIMTAEKFIEFSEFLTEEGIIKGAENVWE